MKFLSRKEELILLTIWKLKDNAYGVPIRESISASTGKYWSIGAIYDVLDRLVSKGYLSAESGQPTAERGGKSKRFYFLTKKGHKLLLEIKSLEESMWADLPSPLLKRS